MENTFTNNEIDESQYSRQLHTFGADAQKALENTSVLIYGLTGLGVEIAKCVIMTGVKTVSLHDTQKVCHVDLSTNYYAQNDDVDKNLRVNVVGSKLASLNPKVTVNLSSNKITENDIKKHQIVVVCDELLPDQIEHNLMCRKYCTKFIFAQTQGLFGSVFCDFGDTFEVMDTDGENPSTGVLTHIDSESFITSEPHGLYVGDNITMKINNSDVNDEIIKIINPVTFKTKNTQMTNQILANASYTQKKQGMLLNFLSLEESLKNPEFTTIIMEDFDRSRLLHDYFVAYSYFRLKHNRHPYPWDENDANEILNMVKCETDAQKLVVKKLSYTSVGKLIEIDSIIAPIVAQEVIKAATKKYTPIKQWLHIDKTNMITDYKITSNELKKYGELLNTADMRYITRYIVLGEVQTKIMNSRVFVVGAGAIGCEHLKNLAMMGVKNITITDMDTIEKSNLNRQFLFRNSDIGKSKSEAAKNAILEMNNLVTINAQQNKVCGDTTSVYNSEFFSNIDIVLTALDNIDARKFVDSLCVDNKKPMIDSGTLGTKGNVQIVIPNLTECYSQSQDPPEKEIPMCTLKNFPYQIEHCIQWARDLFEGLFTRAPHDFMKYKENPEKYKSLTEADRNQLTEIVNNVNFVKNNMACHLKECIMFAYKLWHEYFRDQIYNLVQKFPENSVTSEGLPFWTGTKKFPKFCEFTGTEIEMQFLESVTNLWAEVCGINERVTKKQLTTFIKNAKTPSITNKGDIVGENEKQQNELQLATGKPINELINSLPTLEEINTINVNVLNFEKDDDTNFHVNFVTSASNSRATNYSIPIADRFKTKGIAGKIIPAIVTTTSLVSGLVMTEFVKVVQSFNEIEMYSNSFVNLALPVIAFSDPVKIQKIKIGNLEICIGDKLYFNDMKVKDLITTVMNDFVKDNKLQITAISCNPYNLFSLAHSEKLINKRKEMTIFEIVETISGKTIESDIKIFVSFEDIEDSETEYDSIECLIKRS